MWTFLACSPSRPHGCHGSGMRRIERQLYEIIDLFYEIKVMVGKPIQRSARKRFDGFPDPSACWEQSKQHKKHFLDHLNCPERKQYHRNEHACRPFDRLVANIAGERFKISFFYYYQITGVKPPLLTYTNGLITNTRVLKHLATSLFIVKKTRDEIDEVPSEYITWPSNFILEAATALIFPEDRDDIQRAIEACIERRTAFRNMCIRDCCKFIDTRSHDNFLLILQILRARNIVFH